MQKLQSFLFLELHDVSIVVILLLLARLNTLTLLRVEENEAFEYGIITSTHTVKYRQNLIPFSWNLTEWYWLYLVYFFYLRLWEILISFSNTHFGVFHPICKLRTIKNVTTTEQVMSSFNKTSNNLFRNSTFPVLLILSTITT